MHSFDLILTLTGGLTAALVFGYLAKRLGLSPIVGYLLAGTLVGPNTPGFVANTGLAEQLAEVGVILLMFGVGLQFHLDELLAVRRIAVPGALVQSAVATGLGALTAHALGWTWPSAIVFGVALAVASTVVLIRVLSDSDDLHSPVGHIAVGWLVVEDLFTVIILVLLPVVFGGDASAPDQLAIALGFTLLKVAGLVAFTAAAGRHAIPWLLDRVADTRSRELFTLTILVLALGIAVGSAVVFGVSMALGAFLAGMVVGRSDYSLRAAADALPMRDAFAVLFFVSVGMLLDPRALLDSPVLVLATLAIVMIGKPLAAFVVVVLLKYPLRVALGVSVALAQIGEFSFILAELGKELHLITTGAMNALVAVAIVSIVANPVLYRLVNPVERWAAAQPRLQALVTRRLASGPGDEDDGDPAGGQEAHSAVIVGYGPTGRTLARLLRDNGIAPSIVELNMDTVRQLRNDGTRAVYGDASHQSTLEAAGVRRAETLILSASGMDKCSDIIRQARELNPMIRVLARTTQLRDRAGLQKVGADSVYAGEGEVAFALAEDILQHLGASPEHIARERDNVRQDLFG